MLKVEAQENACRAWSQAQSRLPPTTLFGVAPSGTNGFAHMFAQSCHGLRPSLDQVLDKVHAIHVKTHVGLRHILEDQSYMIKGSELCVPLASTPKMHIPLCSMYAAMYIYIYIHIYVHPTNTIRSQGCACFQRILQVAWGNTLRYPWCPGCQALHFMAVRGCTEPSNH